MDLVFELKRDRRTVTSKQKKIASVWGEKSCKQLSLNSPLEETIEHRPRSDLTPLELAPDVTKQPIFLFRSEPRVKPLKPGDKTAVQWVKTHQSSIFMALEDFLYI